MGFAASWSPDCIPSVAIWPVLPIGQQLPGHTVRIAAALTLLSHPDATTVEESTMADAIRLSRAYIPHAVAALSRVHGNVGSTQPAIEVLSWLTQRKASTFTLREVHRALRGRTWVTSANDIRDALRMLDDHGHLRPVEESRESSRAGRKAERYELRPMYLADVMSGVIADSGS